MSSLVVDVIGSEVEVETTARYSYYNLLPKCFKLSYDVNPKLPFIIDCLKLKCNSTYGNHIITEQDLKIGDIVCVQTPFFSIITKNYKNYELFFEMNSCYRRCHNCLKATNIKMLECDVCHKGKLIN